MERQENALSREGDLEAIIASADLLKKFGIVAAYMGLCQGFDRNPYVFSSRIYAAVDLKELKAILQYSALYLAP